MYVHSSAFYADIKEKKYDQIKVHREQLRAGVDIAFS